MESYHKNSFMTGSFHSSICDINTYFCIVTVGLFFAFIGLYIIPLYEYTTIYVSILLLIAIWAVSSLGLTVNKDAMNIMRPCFLFLTDKHLAVELLTQKVDILTS